METIYEKYMALPIDKGLLCLEYGDIADPYFCYPVNAKPIGFEGCILYCFLPEYGEMVFACNPESCVDQNVYPLAANFEDFIRLILACGTANPLEQIVWMDKNKFEEHMANEEKILTDEQRTAAQQLQRALSLLPIENPFEYVKSINHNEKSLEFYHKKQKEKSECKDLLQTKELVSSTNSSEIITIPA